MATSGSLTAWMSTLFGGESFETLVDEAAQSVPGSHGLLLLPYFAGERTPVFDPQARGVIAGLSLRHTRGDLFRSVYEGIAFGIRQILEVFDGTGVGATQRIFAVGGGTRGGLWTQIVSDVTRRTQIIPEQTIGASYGDAWLAGVGIGAVNPTSDWSKPAEIVQPNDSSSDIYDKLFETYKDLYASTQSQVHTLAQIQEDEAAT
jgi:xylulokinase